MAHIRANTKNGKIVSYRFTVCLGRDCNGKQIRKYTTWPIPPDTSTAEEMKAAERAADIWEQELMNEYHKKLEAESAGKAYQIPAEKRLSFPQGDNIFHSRDPNPVPRRVKHFVKRNGLPDLSTHDILLSKRGGQKAAGAHSRAPVGLFCVKYALRLEMKRPI